MSCPKCDLILELERVEDLNVLEYRAHCIGCDWRGTIRQMKCGGCHENTLFLWENQQWKCIICGRVRGASPPKLIN